MSWRTLSWRSIARRSALLLVLSAGLLLPMACGGGWNLENPPNEGGGPGNDGAAAPNAVDVIAQARQAIVENRNEEARNLLTPVIEREPNNATAFSLRGIAFMREGKTYPAVRDLKAAADLAPSAAAYYNLGNALQQAGFYDRAVTAYRAALELAPDDPEILNNYGASLLHQGRTGEAIAVLERVVTMRPNDPEPLTNIGMAYHIDDDYGTAADHYRRAIQLDPDYWPAVFNLAQAYDAQGQDGQASSTWKRYLEMRPNAPDKTKILNRAGLLPEDLQM